MITWNAPTRVCAIEIKDSVNVWLDMMALRVNVRRAQAMSTPTLPAQASIVEVILHSKCIMEGQLLLVVLSLAPKSVNALDMELA